jgi:cAMP-dependent protein kinase regulator
VPPVLSGSAKARLLKRVPFFSGCSKRELEALSNVLTEIEVEEGVDVVRQGDDTREFYVIVSGTADVFRGDTLVRTLNAGEFFGELANLFHAPRSATVRAATRLHLLVSDEPGFFRLIHETKGLHRKIIDALAQRLTPTAL